MITLHSIKQFKKCPILKQYEKTERTSFPLLYPFMKFKNLQKQYHHRCICNEKMYYGDCVTEIPLLLKEGNSYTLYIPLKDCQSIYRYQLEIQFIYYIAYKNGLIISKVNPIVIEKEKNKPLFSIVYKNYKKLLKLNKATILKFDNLIEEMKKTYPIELKKQCLKDGKCPLFKKCFQIQNDSIFYFRDLSLEEKLCKNLEDKMHLDLIPSTQYGENQLKALESGLYVDKEKVRNFLNELPDKVAYLDFEWTSKLNVKKREIEDYVFSASIHIQTDKLTHFSFFNFDEYTVIYNTIQKLKDIPKIIAFNANGGEKIQLKRLMRKYPNLQCEIQSLIERLIDIEQVFRNGSYYDLRFEGKCGLKNLIQIFDIEHPDLDGESVARMFDKLLYQYDKEVISLIKKYNYYDTYALYLLVEKLKEAI